MATKLSLSTSFLDLSVSFEIILNFVDSVVCSFSDSLTEKSVERVSSTKPELWKQLKNTEQALICAGINENKNRMEDLCVGTVKFNLEKSEYIAHALSH